MGGMVFCRGCGREIHQSAASCPGCGARQQAARQGKSKATAGVLALLLGGLGIHRFYLGKWGTGLLYLCTGGLFLVGIVYDFCTLNTQISEVNSGGSGKANA